jgi:allophanate hydrolase subunit 2
LKQSTAGISETAADIINNSYDLGIAMGAIQVPGDGRPIVLMADRQSTGGYPKIATVIGPDLGRLAQARPGTTFRFEAVSIEEAVAARRQEARAGAGHCRRAAIACASQP